MVDTTTSTFTTIDTEAAGVSGYSENAWRYDAAVALGGKVYFAPRNQDSLGVVDAASSTFSTIDVAAAGAIGNYKYQGTPAVLGTTVYFAPSNATRTMWVCWHSRHHRRLRRPRPPRRRSLPPRPHRPPP